MIFTVALITGLVVGVADGDTLTVLRDDHQQVKVRLADIDAPEKLQAFGNRSKQSLGALCHGKRAVVTAQANDRYGRTVGRVSCAGVDASEAQVRLGMAWVYEQYVKDRSLYKLQDDARAQGRGLWVDADPLAPWEWRRSRRKSAGE